MYMSEYLKLAEELYEQYSKKKIQSGPTSLTAKGFREIVVNTVKTQIISSEKYSDKNLAAVLSIVFPGVKKEKLLELIVLHKEVV